MNTGHPHAASHLHPLHILLLGNPDEARLVRAQLRGGHFQVTHLVQLGSSASAMTVRLMQPDVWLACCTHSRDIQRIRQITPRTPLVVCSRQEEETHIVRMLDAGADDYVFFSCGKQELQARLHGHGRRYRTCMATTSSHFLKKVGPCLALESEDQQIRLQCAEQCAVVRGQIIHLTPTECTLLLALMRDGGKVLSHQSLLQAVWGEEYCSEVDYIRVYLHTLRLKIEDDPRHPLYLETIMGVGYRFRQPCLPYPTS